MATLADAQRLQKVPPALQSKLTHQFSLAMSEWWVSTLPSETCLAFGGFWRNKCPRFLLSGNCSKEFGMTKGQLCKGPGEVGHVQSTPGLQWKLAQKLGMESLRCTHEDSTTPQYVDSTY